MLYSSQVEASNSEDPEDNDARFDLRLTDLSTSISPAFKYLNLILFEVGPQIIAICITTISYIKVGVAAKSASEETLQLWMIRPSYLMWYPLSQLILYFPYLFAGILFVTTKEKPFVVSLIWRTLIHSTGFVNSIIYLTMRREIKKTNKMMSLDVSFNRNSKLLSKNQPSVCEVSMTIHSAETTQ